MTFTSCSACHATNPVRARFCRGCGSRMAEHEAQKDAYLASLQICSNCNTRCPATAKFCRGCGESFADADLLISDFHPCPECSAQCATHAKFCKACGHLFTDQARPALHEALAATAPPEPFAEYAAHISGDDAEQLNEIYALLDQVEKLAATSPETPTETAQSTAAENIGPTPTASITPQVAVAQEPQPSTLQAPPVIAAAARHESTTTLPRWQDKLLNASRTIALATVFILMLGVVAMYWYRYQQEAPIRAAAEQARRETAARVKAENEARELAEAHARAVAEAEAAERARAEAAAEQDALAWPKDEIRLQKEADARAREARLREIARAEARAKAKAEAAAREQARIEAEMARRAKLENARNEAKNLQAATDKNSRNKKPATPAVPTMPTEAPPPAQAKSLDETYREKSQACESSFGSFFCKERLRYQLCANRWNSDPKPGEKICLQQQNPQ